jgi:hypothetical protein
MTVDSAELPLDMFEGAGDSIDYPKEIETVISSLAEDGRAMVGYSEAGHVWKFKYGSVEVFVQLSGSTEDDTLTVWSPVLDLPTKDDAGLMKKLLAMNWKNTFESCFALAEEKVVVMSSRTVMDLNPGEISRTITVVATIADENDEDLIAEFQN